MTPRHLRRYWRSTCGHEATHAIAAYVLGLPIKHVTCVQEGSTISGAVTVLHPEWYVAWHDALPHALSTGTWPPLTPAQRDFAVADMIVALSAPLRSGGLAVYVLDEGTPRVVLEQLLTPGFHTLTDGEWAERIALGLVAGEAVRAAALLDRATHAFEAWWGEPQARAQRAVARALERTGRLTGKQVAALCAHAGCTPVRTGAAPWLELGQADGVR